MAAHGKKQQSDSADAKAERRRQIRHKMERMGLDPEQRRFIEEMLDGETDDERQDDAASE